jgi:hypothetical protein
LSYKDVKKVCEDLKSIYNAPREKAGYEKLEEFWKNGIVSINTLARAGNVIGLSLARFGSIRQK